MSPHRYVSGFQIARQSIAVVLSVLMIPFASGTLLAQDPNGPPPAYAPLDPPALNQLVAPIALYPDSLVAQILTAATYPQQVTDANSWVQQTPGMPPQQRADTANGMPWDPSIKSLTAFPAVLDNLARNYNWTVSLGNAYYNQPGDVMNAVQAARYQAQQSGYLRTTPQQQVVYNDGLITIVPVNPAVVYVPYYDPWRIYGGWVVPYRGFYVAPPPRGVVVGVGIGLGFAVGISIGLWAHYDWGYHHWEPNWHGGTVIYNHNTYISNSVTVINRGRFGGYNRGVYERPGAGVPEHFRPAVTREGFARSAPAARPGFDRPAAAREDRGQFNRPAPAAARPDFNRPAPAREDRGQFNRPAEAPRAQQPAPARPDFNRPAPAARPAPEARPAAPAPQARPAAPAPQARPEARPAPQQQQQRPAEQRGGGEQRGREQRGGEQRGGGHEEHERR